MSIFTKKKLGRGLHFSADATGRPQ